MVSNSLWIHSPSGSPGPPYQTPVVLILPSLSLPHFWNRPHHLVLKNTKAKPLDNSAVQMTYMPVSTLIPSSAFGQDPSILLLFGNLGIPMILAHPSCTSCIFTSLWFHPTIYWCLNMKLLFQSSSFLTQLLWMSSCTFMLSVLLPYVVGHAYSLSNGMWTYLSEIPG